MERASTCLAQALALIALAALPLTGCNGPGDSDPAPPNGGNAELLAVHFGQAVDVYGYVTVGGALEPQLWQRDVLVGPDINDEVSNGRFGGGDPRYDFLTPDPDTLQPRLLVLAELGSKRFEELTGRLDDRVELLTPHRRDDDNAIYSVVPRNASLRLTFSRDLGIDASFFSAGGENGSGAALRNATAVQLLELGGFDDNGNEVLVPMPIRISPQGSQLLIDPVLLGGEARSWGSINNAAGMPSSNNLFGANMRLALPLSGKKSIPGLRPLRRAPVLGEDLTRVESIVRDFRSGNSDDNSARISRGFLRDGTRPRLLGELPMRLAAVRRADSTSLNLRIYKNGIEHELDTGDSIRIDTGAVGDPRIITEVLADPPEDRFAPAVQFVDVRVRNVAGLLELDPRNRPDYPSDPALLRGWLDESAPIAVLIAPFQASRIDPATGEPSRDDPRWFVRFEPRSLDPLALLPTENVRVFSGAVLRFTKPMDMDTLRPLDTMFLGTRDLLSQSALDDAARELGIPAAFFDADKFRTPHLIGSRVIDEDGTQTIVRLQPLLGFYLDETMRTAAAAGQPFEYWLHLLGGSEGLRDLAGQPVDFESDEPAIGDRLSIPLTVDARMDGNNPTQGDNLVVYKCSRFETFDEDERPSYYLPSERPQEGGADPARLSVDDLFGSHVYLDGYLQGRPTGRIRRVADDQNQGPVPSQDSVFRYCFQAAAPPSPTGATPFGQGIQNPLNPFGSRVQMCWREIDMSLSRTSPADMDLDVEQMYWAPLTSATIYFDVFDHTSLLLGHSEQRPEPCVGNFSALASMPRSGLGIDFRRNFVWNPGLDGNFAESQPRPHGAFINREMTITASQAVLDPTGTNRFLPLPEFERPYFVWRDQTVTEQGGELGNQFIDMSDTVQQRNVSSSSRDGRWDPYILSPWLAGRGDNAAVVNGALQFSNGTWNNGSNRRLNNRGQRDAATGGLLGSIALPLLADFQVLCDEPDLPAANPFRATGFNGWQISITVQSGAQPAFRAASGGRPAHLTSEICLSASSPEFQEASGVYNLENQRLPPTDNSLYWIMMDLLRRQTITTSGFVDMQDPHRVPDTLPDPRLRPSLEPGMRPEFVWQTDPATRAPGTTVALEFRAASAVDPEPWMWREDNVLRTPSLGYAQPDETNVPLDPRKACDAHIRKLDDRAGRTGWTHYYQSVVTDYVEDPNELFNPRFAAGYSNPGTTFTPDDIRYVNWRLRMTNAVDATPPISPQIDSVLWAWRWR